MDVAVVLLTVIAAAAVLAVAPARRSRRRARLSLPRRPAGESRAGGFLAVCRECLEMVEGDSQTTHCPACGAALVVRQRIVDQRPRRRSRTPVAR
jgi:uncharacterized paraquat-inducible protein A